MPAISSLHGSACERPEESFTGLRALFAAMSIVTDKPFVIGDSITMDLLLPTG